jgi:hypothetical protein
VLTFEQQCSKFDSSISTPDPPHCLETQRLVKARKQAVATEPKCSGLLCEVCDLQAACQGEGLNVDWLQMLCGGRQLLCSDRTGDVLRPSANDKAQRWAKRCQEVKFGGRTVLRGDTVIAER